MNRASTLLLGAWLLVVAVAGVPAARAQTTGWVTDQLSVTVRTGKGPEYAIVKVLGSGTAVRVLERDPETGYARVRTPGGEEGWMLARYLMQQPAARERLPALEARVAELEAENERLAGRLASLESAGAGAEQHAEALEKELDALHGEVLILRRGAALRWLLWGGGVALAGVLLGLLAGRSRRRQW